MTVALDIDQADIDRSWVRRRGLREFVRRAWPQVEPSPLVWGWHLDAVCEHLEAVSAREIRDLAIHLPPGCSKSLVVSVLWPAWQWTRDPQHRWICASFAPSVSLRDARKCRGLVDSDWYQARWGDTVRIPNDASASASAAQYFTTAGGMRYSTTVRGAVTGQHGDTHLVDDPLDPQGAAALSGVELDQVVAWWNETMSTRFRDLSTGARVLVMQRLHERDLGAEMRRAGATVLCLPMRYEPNHPQRYARDPRTTPGELLNPARFPEAELVKVERTLGPRATAAQLQQRPVPAGGLIFREDYFRHRWTELPDGGTYTLSVDCAFKDTRTSSWVVIQAWYQKGPNHYLVDQARGHWGFAATCQEILAMAARYPKAIRKLVEDKANGTAVLETLEDKLPGLEPVNPEGGKEARAHASEPLWAAGNVFVPHPEKARYADGRVGAAWVQEFVAEHLAFPLGQADDQVDAATQYLTRYGRNPAHLLKRAMANVYKKG